MQQDIPGISDPANPFDTDPNESANLARSALPADELELEGVLIEPSQAAVSTPYPGEDAILMVETITFPDQGERLSPEDVLPADAEAVIVGPLNGLLGGVPDTKRALPWYRNQWLYVGVGLVTAATLSLGTIFLIQRLTKRNRQPFAAQRLKKSLAPRNLPSPRQTASRAQGTLSRWSGQVGGQTGKLVSQTQKQISRLTYRAQAASSSLNPLQRRARGAQPLNRARQQLTSLSRQVGDQVSALGGTTRQATGRAVGQAQERFSQFGDSLSAGAARTGAGLQRGWKLSRNFSVGAAIGAVWGALFTPQSGEATRARLAQTFQSRMRKNQA